MPMFFFDENQANEYDLLYDEIIIFQLKMIDYIARKQLKMLIIFVTLAGLSFS